MPYSPERRSERILLDVPLVIQGMSEGKRPFREETFTLTVSAHGALVMLENRVVLGQRIVLMNPKNWEEQEGRVAFVGPDRAGLAQVGIEFSRPSPQFWSLTAPPQNWNAFQPPR